MDSVIKEAKLEREFPDINQVGATVADLHAIISDNKQKAIDRIQKLFPSLKIFDCHRLKAALLDMKKSGKIVELMIQEGSVSKEQAQKLEEALRKEGEAAKADNSTSGLKSLPDTITPNKLDRHSSYFASIDVLRGKSRKPIGSFKRREALNKKGWGKDENQMTIDQFLVPKRKKKLENTKLMMMG